MRRTLRWSGILLAVATGLPLLAALAVWGALNTDAGQRLAAQQAATLSGGMVTLSGLSGAFPQALRVAQVEVHDDKGTWLTVRDAALDWDPLRLLQREVHVGLLSAAEVSVDRLPESHPSQPEKSPSTDSGSSLPARVVLDALRIDRVTLAATVAGTPAVLAVEGKATVASLTSGSADIALHRLDGAGSYHLVASADSDAVAGELTAEEPAHGLASEVAGLPDLGALALAASVDGPWSGIVTKLTLTAGDLKASAQGTVDVRNQTADLDVTASAPAMKPRPDLSWQAVQMDAHVHGPWLRPRAQGTVAIDSLAAAGATLRRLAADVHGDLGKVSLRATAEALRIPGPAPNLLAAAPVSLQADAQLDDPARPVTFSLSHPLLNATGTARTAGEMGVTAHLALPDLAPLASLGAPPLQGHATFDVRATLPATGPSTTVDGTLALTDGPKPVPDLIGAEAHLALAAALHGEQVQIDRLEFVGKNVSFAAHGDAAAGSLDVSFQAGLPDLSIAAPSIQGKLQAEGRVHGAPTDLAAEATVTGEVASAQVPRGPIKLVLAAHGLPNAPAGTVKAEGSLDGAPLAFDLAADRTADGALHLGIDHANWKSVHAEGALTLAPAATLPTGKVSLRMDRLADMSAVTGQALAGAFTAELSAEPNDVRLKASVKNTAIAGTASVGAGTLDVRVRDPLTTRAIDGSIDLTGINAGGIGGSARLEAKGSPEMLALQLRSNLTGLGDSALDASAAASVDVPGNVAQVSAFQAAWHGETLRLLGPARIAYGAGLRFDRIRLGVRDAVLELAGKISPALDLTASLRTLPADLASVAMPDTHLAGTLQADARVTGPAAHPQGRLHLAATGLHLREGPGAALPPATIVADAILGGTTAQLNAQAKAGVNVVNLSGTVPASSSGPMNLRTTGSIDLAVLDPLLAGAGRRARGKVTLDATVTGTATAPQASGSITLAQGDVQDVAQGLHLSNLDARVQAEGDTLRIAHLTGRAGPGTISASGAIGLSGTMPVDLAITAKQARPLASDLLTASLDSDLAVKGALLGPIAITGSVTINRADIRVPERLPAKVVVLDVRRPGQKPPASTAPGPEIGLNVTVRAPGQVFVRGRGLDAELQGRITLAGTTAALQPSGRFSLRRGSFNLAGTTLNFTSGEIGFDGSAGLDPTLNFVATSTTSSVTATLTVTGYASAPKFVLSSSPELPQDEILSQLLFHQNSASLSGFQLAEAAAALAQISGVGGGFDPLNKVRSGLGLDRLSVGSAQSGNGATVEAGRYVAPGLYVGAKQGSSGSGTQALVQYDLTRRLKLQATAGASGTTSATGSASTDDPTGTSIGLTYQFDY